MDAKTNIKDAEPQTGTVRIDLKAQYRSAAHTIIKCLAFFKPELVSNNLTREIREFVRDGKGDWRFFAVDVEQYFSMAEEAANMLCLGVYHNSVEIYWDSATKMVVGVLTILNRVKRAVVIAKGCSEPNQILYAFENTHGSKKTPKALLAQFNPNQFHPPIINFRYFSCLNKIHHYFEAELRTLAEIVYPIDAITAKLVKELTIINNKNLKVTKDTLEEYLNMFLGCLLDLGKASGYSLDSDGLRSKLFKYGFTDLADRHSGKLYTDPDVEKLISSTFRRALTDLELEGSNMPDMLAQ